MIDSDQDDLSLSFCDGMLHVVLYNLFLILVHVYNETSVFTMNCCFVANRMDATQKLGAMIY